MILNFFTIYIYRQKIRAARPQAASSAVGCSAGSAAPSRARRLPVFHHRELSAPWARETPPFPQAEATGH